MTDPERDLAAKVRDEFDALPDVLMVGPPELDESFARFGAALDSLLALTVKYREALTEIAEGYPHSHDEGHGDAANCAVCFAADTINDADPAHDEGSLE